MEQHFVLLRERAAPPQHGPRKGPEQASEQGSKDKSRKDKGSGKRTREEGDTSEESSSKAKK
jgi:hypothetical protein